MKFSVGYSLIERERFNLAVNNYRSCIEEIYFSWPGNPSGRFYPLAGNEDYEEQSSMLVNDLLDYSDNGIPLVVLFNANCYGSEAVSSGLKKQILQTIDQIQLEGIALKGITTASPFIAWIVKNHFPNLQVRASINMQIRTIEGIEYLSDRFDFFYVGKELNRDIDSLRKLKSLTGSMEKEIGILVNSGCLNYCSNQIFHDNLVAHESELKNYNPDFYHPVQCRSFLKHKNNRNALLNKTNWIRPEEISLYDELFDVVKLATRMHSNPYMIIASYASGCHEGNILDLTEPSFSNIIYPKILANERFPENWYNRCTSKKETQEILDSVLISI